VTGREIGLQFGWLAGVKRFQEQSTACREAATYFKNLGQPEGWGEQYEQKAKEIEGYT
jgi:hypothetical protein